MFDSRVARANQHPKKRNTTQTQKHTTSYLRHVWTYI